MDCDSLEHDETYAGAMEKRILQTLDAVVKQSDGSAPQKKQSAYDYVVEYFSGVACALHRLANNLKFGM